MPLLMPTVNAYVDPINTTGQLWCGTWRSRRWKDQSGGGGRGWAKGIPMPLGDRGSW